MKYSYNGENCAKGSVATKYVLTVFLFKYKIICASKYCHFECDRKSNAWKSIDNCIDIEECKIVIKTCFCKSLLPLQPKTFEAIFFISDHWKTGHTSYAQFWKVLCNCLVLGHWLRSWALVSCVLIKYFTCL